MGTCNKMERFIKGNETVQREQLYTSLMELIISYPVSDNSKYLVSRMFWHKCNQLFDVEHKKIKEK